MTEAVSKNIGEQDQEIRHLIYTQRAIALLGIATMAAGLAGSAYYGGESFNATNYEYMQQTIDHAMKWGAIFIASSSVTGLSLVRQQFLRSQRT